MVVYIPVVAARSSYSEILYQTVQAILIGTSLQDCKCIGTLSRHFITGSAYLLNRCIGVLCYYNSMYSVYTKYTWNTYFVMHWSMLFILLIKVNIRIQ